MEPVDSPGAEPGPEVAENLFAEYSYVAPSILFTENNVISEDMFRPNPDKKPSTSNLVGCILLVSARVTLIIGTACQSQCLRKALINQWFARFERKKFDILVLPQQTGSYCCYLQPNQPLARLAYCHLKT